MVWAVEEVREVRRESVPDEMHARRTGDGPRQPRGGVARVGRRQVREDVPPERMRRLSATQTV